MNGNNPYAGRPGTEPAGRRSSADLVQVTAGQRRALRRDVSRLAARTREYLPDEFVVEGEVSRGSAGPRVTVAVRPPVGRPVSAGFAPNLEAAGPEDDRGESPALLDAADRTEVARELAATAALQAKVATAGQGVVPAAR